MNEFFSSERGSQILNVGGWDIGVKITVGLAAASAAVGAIAVPNNREKEETALRLFDKPSSRCTPQEKRVAEFAAGHKRWNDFFQSNVYPLTRQLPGAKNPFLNPFKDAPPMKSALDNDE